MEQDQLQVKVFLPKAISRKKITEIIQSGLNAPRTNNSNLWQFVVIKENKTLKNSLINILERKITKAPKVITALKTSDTIIMIYADIIDPVIDVASSGACIENMLLKAKSLGLSSIWFGYTLKIEEDLKKILNINKTLIAIIALGYTNKEPKPPQIINPEEAIIWH